MRSFSDALKKKVRFTGISTSIFGLSWEYIDKDTEILRELYVMRNKLAYFVYEYECFCDDLQMRIIDDGDFEESIYYKYRLSIIEVYREVGSLLLGSKYFSSLENDKRIGIIEVFDQVIYLWAFINAHEDNINDIEPEEVEKMIQDLLNLFNEINMNLKLPNTI